jgi:hypothetical protein
MWAPSCIGVGHVLAPRHGAAGVVVLLHRDVDHEAVRRRAVPVVLVGLEEDAVARADELHLAALALAEADALGDEDRLAVRVGVPRCPRARCEVHSRGSEGRGAGGRCDRVDVDVAREPVRGALLRFDAVSRDLHWFVSFPYAAGWSEIRRMRLAWSPSSDSTISRPLTTAVTSIADLKPLTVCSAVA